VIIVRLGIADDIKSKITVVRGMPVAAAVAKGNVELGIHQIAELMQVPGIDIVGELPAELNRTIVYATALTTMAKQSDAAKEFVNFFSLPSSAPVIKKDGMNPA
jgi:molybdate transport system substrate-binding protein